MAYDPSIPDDVKKRFNNGVRPGVRVDPTGTDLYRDGAIAPAAQDSWLARASAPQTNVGPPVDTGVRSNVLAPTPDAVSAGPPRAGVIDGGAVKPPSPLDADQPLPAGVRQYKSAGYQGSPGTNDVIYEGRGAHGERSFSNNQFSSDLRGGAMNLGLDALAKARSGEISGYLGSQQAAANAAAGAAAIAPKTADEYTTRIKALSDIAATRATLPSKERAAALDAAGKAGDNINSDPFTKTSEGVREAALKSGATPEQALEHGQIAAATQAIDAGLSPQDASLPPAARAGTASIKRGLANILNSGTTTGANLSNVFPFLHHGTVTDPDAANLADYSISGPDTFGHRSLVGPTDENGRRRQVLISDEDATRYGPAISAMQRRSRKSN